MFDILNDDKKNFNEKNKLRETNAQQSRD